MKTYKVVRFYQNNERLNRTVVRTGLTLEEAQKHCKDPETSSTTCKRKANVERTLRHGAWFDGYEEEK